MKELLIKDDTSINLRSHLGGGRDLYILEVDGQTFISADKYEGDVARMCHVLLAVKYMCGEAGRSINFKWNTSIKLKKDEDWDWHLQKDGSQFRSGGAINLIVDDQYLYRFRYLKRAVKVAADLNFISSFLKYS